MVCAHSFAVPELFRAEALVFEGGGVTVLTSALRAGDGPASPNVRENRVFVYMCSCALLHPMLHRAIWILALGPTLWSRRGAVGASTR